MLCLAIRHGVTVDVGGSSITAVLHPFQESAVVFTANGRRLESVPLALAESFEFAGGTVKFYKILRRDSARVPVLAFEHPKHIPIARSDATAKTPRLQTATAQ